RLRHDNGNIIGDSGEGYSDRGALDEAVERVKAYAPMANVLRLDNGAFDVYAADGAWRWRLLNSRGRIVAESPDTFERRADAVDSLEPLRDVDSLEPDLQRENDRVRWSLTVAGDVVATGVQPYANERNANEAIERAKHLADTADVLTLEAGAFDLYRDQAEEWRWRLLASNGRIIADSGEGYGARAKARQGIASVQRNAPDAPVRG
ncbi:MAG: HVO_2922 family protein, partial [Halobacteriota archaeon]